MYNTVFDDNTADRQYLTNSCKADFQIDGIKFFNVSQFMKYKEALSYEDNDTAEKILQCVSNKELGKLQIKRDKEKAYRWIVDRNAFLKEAVYEKFKQNINFATLLRHTNGEIIYLSEDEYLGVRFIGNDKTKIKKEELVGANQLGYTLMFVRHILMKELFDLAEQVKQKN